MPNSKIPTKAECLILWKEQGLPQNVIDHSILVNKIAVFLAEQLRDSGIKVNIDLVDKASLLHDIARPIDFGRATNLHPRIGAEILAKKGYSEIAEITRKHTVTSILEHDQKDRPKTWEEKIVFYADKREDQNNIVSVHERLLGWKEMQDPKEFTKYFEAVSALEREIFDKLLIRPDQLRDALLKWSAEQG